MFLILAGCDSRTVRFVQMADPRMGMFSDNENLDYETSLQLYRCLYGKDYYRFKKGPLYGIVLNSSLMREDSMANDEAAKQDQWLCKTILQPRFFIKPA